MSFFGMRMTSSFFSRSCLSFARVGVALVIEHDRRDSWPTPLPKKMCYGNIIPRNRWSSDQVPMQDQKTKRTVDFKGAKRVHVKTHKTDFDRRFVRFK
eukprot:UN16652